jgi:hypothetical protein
MALWTKMSSFARKCEQISLPSASMGLIFFRFVKSVPHPDDYDKAQSAQNGAFNQEEDCNSIAWCRF